MTLTRRRFLSITAGTAGATLVGTAAQAQNWTGHAFGAEVSITLRGPHDQTAPALRAARALIAETEHLFSLYAPLSALSALNRDGVLDAPDPAFLTLMQAADDAYHLTDGLFDPTVQRLWQVTARGHKPHEYYDTIDWRRVQVSTQRITLGHHQALTLNGIAQGFATDRVSDLLHAHGLTDTLVNIGEHRATGGPWRLGLTDPTHGPLGHRTLTTGAIATSSPAATPMGALGHIIHKTAVPQWSTVSVEAPTATQADALSTALVLAPLAQIHAIKARSDMTRVTLVDADGNLTTV